MGFVAMFFWSVQEDSVKSSIPFRLRSFENVNVYFSGVGSQFGGEFPSLHLTGGEALKTQRRRQSSVTDPQHITTRQGNTR